MQNPCTQQQLRQEQQKKALHKTNYVWKKIKEKIKKQMAKNTSKLLLEEQKILIILRLLLLNNNNNTKIKIKINEK